MSHKQCYEKRKELLAVIDTLKWELSKFYHADGTFEIMPRNVVEAKRIECAKEIASLKAKLTDAEHTIGIYEATAPIQVWKRRALKAEAKLEKAEKVVEAANHAIYTAGSPHYSLKDCALGVALKAYDDAKGRE